jgi:hypothetical protein
MISYKRKRKPVVPTYQFVRYVFACASPLFSFPMANLLRVNVCQDWSYTSRATRQDVFLAEFVRRTMLNIKRWDIERAHPNERSMAQAFVLSAYPPAVGEQDPLVVKLDFNDELGEIDLQLIKDLDSWLELLFNVTDNFLSDNLARLFAGVATHPLDLEKDTPVFEILTEKDGEFAKRGERLREKLWSYDFHLVGLILVALKKRYSELSDWQDVLSRSGMKSLKIMAEALEVALKFKEAK